jgi:uncharacterized protein YigE (DUF2233 family)
MIKRKAENQVGFDVAESIKAQSDYQKKTGNPDFAPRSGICYSCGTQIYQRMEIESGDKKWYSGVSTEKAFQFHIGAIRRPV